MNPFLARSRAEELARLLDAMPVMGAAPRSAPALAQSLRDLGSSTSPALVPRAEFRAALRTRLVAVASVQAVTAASATASPTRATAAHPAPAWLTGRRARQGAGVAAGALASVVAVSGVAVASSAALPGDPFYGVKRTTEALQLRVADSEMEEGGRHLEFAANRLREVRGLTLGRSAADDATAATGAELSGPVAERVRQTLADMDAETRAGSRLMTEAFHTSQTPAPLLALARFTSRQSARLEGLMPVLPAQAQDRAWASLALLTGVSQEAGQLLDLDACPPSCAPMLAPTETSPTPSPTARPSASPAAPAVDGEDGREQEPVPPSTGPEPRPSAAAETSPRPTPRASTRPRPREVLPPRDRSAVPVPRPSRSSVPLPGLPEVTSPLEELLSPGELGLTPPPHGSRLR